MQLQQELAQSMLSNDPEQQLLCAYHWGNFGFNALTLKFLKNGGMKDKEVYLRHLRPLDARFVYSSIGFNDYTRVIKGNCDFLTAQEFEVEFKEYEGDTREIGVYIQLLPVLEYIKNNSAVKTMYINCNERLRELFAAYFPYVKIGTHANKVSSLQLLEHVHAQGGAAHIRRAIKSISNRIRTNKNPRFIGINWHCNTILDRYRSIPIGLLINTVGAHAKNLQVKSLQYNDPKIEIEIYNTYSKNKIVSVFDNDINTSALDILNATAECYCVVGIQSEPIMMAAWLLGIPTIVAASSPNFYWYFLNQLNPNLHLTQMRFAGDYDYVIKNINKWL